VSPPPPPPLFAYHYWKCYYPRDSPHFKAAALYSTEVDYFKYGQCRLAHSSYFCGPMSLGSPYKGFASTMETTDGHIGTDAHRAADRAKYDPNDYVKVQQAANPWYYQNPGGEGSANRIYRSGLPNNGQALSFPTKKIGETVALYNNGEIHQAVGMEYARADAAASATADSVNHNHVGHSNYAMSQGAQTLYGARENVHHATLQD